MQTIEKTRVLVWDAPVRVFHWLMVLSFAGAYLTAESERWRLVHVSLGYTMAGLIVWRLLWGLVGTRYARFASFVRSPATVWRYLMAMLRGAPEHHIGHNPAGAVAIVLLLLLGAMCVGSGWAVYNDVGGKLVEELHEGVAGFMLALVGFHVAGALVTSWLHRENLVRAMFTGIKLACPDQGIAKAWNGLAALLLAAALGFWWLQWQGAPQAQDTAAAPSSLTNHKLHDDDDD